MKMYNKGRAGKVKRPLYILSFLKMVVNGIRHNIEITDGRLFAR